MFCTLTLFALVLGSEAGPSVPLPEKIRETVEKGLAFLEKDGVEWTQKHKCSSCHHVPFMLWNQQEARRRGIKINEPARDSTLAFALKAPPGGFFGPLKPEELAELKGPSLEIIFLTLALGGENQPDDAAQKLQEFKAHLLDKQDSNGSWKFTRKDVDKILAPIQDTDDTITVLALLALTGGDSSRLDKNILQQSQSQALAWLKDSAPENNNHSLTLRIVLHQRFGQSNQTQQFTKQLLSEQRDDGGWGQVKDRPSDAVASGQALYALSAAGFDTKHDSVARGIAFLVHTQQDNGSWKVSSRVPKNKDVIPSYFGSGWAVLGMIQHINK